VLSTVSGVLIASSASVDGARRAAATLDWLRQNRYQRLFADAWVVINHLVPGKPSVDVADLTEHSSAASVLDGSWCAGGQARRGRARRVRRHCNPLPAQ